MPDGAPTSMDNTRIMAAREAGVKVEANVHNFNDRLSSKERIRFKHDGIEPQIGEKLSSYELESKKHKKEFQKGGAKDFLTEVFMM